MALTDKEKLELRAYCAALLKEHGFEFSPTDPVLPAIYVMHKEMQLCIEANKLIAERVDKAAAKINPRAFHFNHAGEAWKFQLAIALKWILCGGLILVGISIGIWRWSLYKDIDRARTIIHAYDNLSQLAAHTEKNGNGSYFIELSEDKGDSVQHFREYVRIDNKTIRVFLGKE